MLCPLKSANDYITCGPRRRAAAIMLFLQNPKGSRTETEVPLLKNIPRKGRKTLRFLAHTAPGFG
jgi:hypothetical protein